MWFADVVVDFVWFVESRGNLGEPRARATQYVVEPAGLRTEVLLYGDDEAIRHMRVMIHADDHATADACVDHNIHYWVAALEVSSALTTPTFATVAKLQKNSARFMVILGLGDERTAAVQINPQYAAPQKADFSNAVKLMTCWKPDFRIHLHYLSRFLNDSLLPETRWHNGYRFLEWHFRRGKVGLASDKTYRAFLEKHGAVLDPHLRPQQTRHGLIEETRALVAHALLAKPAEVETEGATTDLVLKTFSALEALIADVMNEGATGLTFFPKPADSGSRIAP